MIADSAVELEQFRLLVLKTAWIIDTQPHGAARTHIGMCKIQLGKVFYEIARRAVHLHGSLGVSLETPLYKIWAGAPTLAVADGPTEVHQVQVAKALLKQARGTDGMFPTDHIPTRLEEAKKKYAHLLEDSSWILCSTFQVRSHWSRVARAGWAMKWSRRWPSAAPTSSLPAARSKRVNALRKKCAPWGGGRCPLPPMSGVGSSATRCSMPSMTSSADWTFSSTTPACLRRHRATK